MVNANVFVITPLIRAQALQSFCRYCVSCPSFRISLYGSAGIFWVVQPVT